MRRDEKSGPPVRNLTSEVTFSLLHLFCTTRRREWGRCASLQSNMRSCSCSCRRYLMSVGLLAAKGPMRITRAKLRVGSLSFVHHSAASTATTHTKTTHQQLLLLLSTGVANHHSLVTSTIRRTASLTYRFASKGNISENECSCTLNPKNPLSPTFYITFRA